MSNVRLFLLYFLLGFVAVFAVAFAGRFVWNTVVHAGVF